MALRSLVIAAAAAAVGAAPAVAAPFKPHELIVHYADGTSAAQRENAARAAGAVSERPLPAGSRELRIARTTSVRAAAARLNSDPRVRYAVPNYIAHASYYPNDTGFGGRGGWAQMQWNFTGAFGVNAPRAWDEAIAAGAAGGRGVKVAVLDTGVAYERYRRFRHDPDLPRKRRFARGWDFVGHDAHPNDQNGHGSHVTGTIAQSTNNALGATGLAYRATIMPVRVLNAYGEGDAGTIARAIRWAVAHRARVINLSLEFDSGTTAAAIPDILRAVRFAHRRGVVVVGAAGNAANSAVAYPARASRVISVGGTTEHGCQADYSNSGRGLDVVAPGGGADAANEDDPGDLQNCRPADAAGREIFQYTFTHSVRTFGLPGGYEGTSMACPHVSAIAALIIATKVIGAHPSPDAVERRIAATARDLGPPGYDRRYGWGLVDAAAAIDRNVKSS